MAWYNESKRHSDAAKGRKTGRKERRTLNFKNPPRLEYLGYLIFDKRNMEEVSRFGQNRFNIREEREKWLEKYPPSRYVWVEWAAAVPEKKASKKRVPLTPDTAREWFSNLTPAQQHDAMTPGDAPWSFKED